MAILTGVKASDITPPVYHFHVRIRRIRPMVWRRLLFRSESTLANLHDTLQIAFGRDDSQLHRYRIHGPDFGLSHVGGPTFSSEARQVRLAEVQFRGNRRFLYEDEFGDGWHHEVRIEGDPEVESMRPNPVCISGQRAASPEHCDGIWACLESKVAALMHYGLTLDLLAEILPLGQELNKNPIRRQ